MTEQTKITTKWGKMMYALIFCHNLKPSMINALCRKYAKGNTSNDAEPGLDVDLILLDEAIDTIQPVCIPEHKRSGLELLHNLAYTPTGKRRRTKDAEKFCEGDLRVLANATEIAFVRMESEFGSYGRCTTYPIFEVRSDYGRFQYYYRSWQTGGGFEIVLPN